MPAGISDPVLGYAVFFAIKFVGYIAAAQVLSEQYDRDVSAWKVGAIRTLIGGATGAAYLGLWSLIVGHVSGGIHGGIPLLHLVGLLPVRLAEWWLLIWLFYDRELRQVAKDWRMAAVGTIWSYVLDAPAIAGFLAFPGV